MNTQSVLQDVMNTSNRVETSGHETASQHEWFYFEDASGGNMNSNTLVLKKHTNRSPNVKLEYSFDGNTWNKWGTTSTTALTLSIPTNGRVYLRGLNNSFGSFDGFNYFGSTRKVRCGGVISSLLTNSKEPLLDLTGHSYAYRQLFAGMTNLLNAPELPATTLSGYCYYYMFEDCESLTTVPALPATTLALYCYAGMFYNCPLLGQYGIRS